MFPGVLVPGQDQAFGTSQALKEAITAALEVPLLSALLTIQHHHCTCPTSLHALLSGPCCCWHPTRVTLRHLGVFAFPPDLNGSFERQRLSLHIPALRIESILWSALGRGKEKREKPHNEGKGTGPTIRVIDSNGRRRTRCRGDAGACWGDAEPGAAGLGER